MQKVLTAAEMREVDRLTTERYGIPSILLMENAAHAVARVITEKLGGSVKGKSILVLCGKGNNGGDGAALARILELNGAYTFVALLGGRTEVDGDARSNLNFAYQLSHFMEIGSLQEWKEWWWNGGVSTDWQVVVDGIFGTGLNRAIEGWQGDIISFLNDYFEQTNFDPPCFRLSIDIPSGLGSDFSSPIGTTFHADVTVTFAAPKVGNVVPPAASLNGELLVADIGCDDLVIQEQSSQLYLGESQDAKAWIEQTKFSDDSYKNKRGHCLIVAGSVSYSGAAVLAGDAAMRSGVGLVTIATPNSSKESIAARVLPEVMIRGVAETNGGAVAEEALDELSDLLEKADAVAVGSGLSQDESTKRFVEKLVRRRTQPMVVDADALNLLSPLKENHPDAEASPLLRKEGSLSPLILTPHEGEFMRLLGTEDKDVLKDRVVVVREFAEKHGVILVLKGERVLIGEPGGKVVVNPTGNAGLGKAGNGDTLTGILAGFVAQAAKMNIDIFETVVAAVYIAGMAGDVADKKYGKRVMTASDVRECLVEVLTSLSEK